MSKNAKASEEDYAKFKKLLRFFARQANKNADNGRAERPAKNRNAERPALGFIEHYGLEPEFDIIAGIPFTIRFWMPAGFNYEHTTYINMDLFSIAGNFENRRVTALRNFIMLDTPDLSVAGETRKLCAERNQMFKYHSIESLDIHSDNNAPPNAALKNLLDEYLETYNTLHEIVMESSSPCKT